MAEVDDAAVAARTKELLADDEAIKTQYGDGTLTVKTLRKAVAAALGVEESAIKKVVKATLLSYMDEQDAPEEEAVVEDDPADEDEQEPKAKKAKKEKKPKAKRTDRLTDKDALNARMKEDNWTVTEKMRPAKDGVAPKKAGDKYFRKPGEAKQYRSLLEIARAHYPEFLTGEPPAKKVKPPSEKKERAPRASASAAKPEKKIVVGKITKAGKGAASSAPPKKKKAEALPSPPPAKKPRPKKPEDTVNSAWASVEERVAAADQVLPKMVEGEQWPEIVKMLKMLGRMDVDVDALTSCGIGRTVSKLRKVPDDDVKKIAKALVTKWKDLVAEQEPIAAEAPAASEPEAPAAAEEDEDAGGGRIEEMGGDSEMADWDGEDEDEDDEEGEEVEDEEEEEEEGAEWKRNVHRRAAESFAKRTNWMQLVYGGAEGGERGGRRRHYDRGGGGGGGGG